MKEIKTCSLLIVIVSLLFSCASTHSVVTHTNNERDVTAKAFVETCSVPDERYFVRQFNAKVFRHRNCMAIDDLLTIVWPGELTDATKNGASMLAIGYTVRLARINPGSEYFVEPLIVDTYRHQNVDYHMSFFELRLRNED